MATFDVAYTAVAGKPAITATATDPDGNTSEVSAPRRPVTLSVGRPQIHRRDVGAITFTDVDGTAIVLDDPEADPVPRVTFTLLASAGTLTLSSIAGLSGTGNGSDTLRYVGTGASLNAAVRGDALRTPRGLLRLGVGETSR